MKQKTIVAIGAAVAVAIVVVVVPPAVLLTPRTGQFRATFKRKCEEFPEQSQICENKWSTFEQAYVGKESCNFPEEDYDPVLDETPFTYTLTTMFWSETKDLVHKFTKKRDCFITLENTLLGYVMDGLSWCGKKGSKETFTHLCERCKNNTVSSFWNQISARFAEYARGEVAVMLDGGNRKPYHPDSVFATIEVPHLRHPRVTNLTVVLLTEEKTCDCESLQNLRKDLHPLIGCTCKAVTRSNINKCIKENTPCGMCW